ncbi:DUF3159 domain-containing protein [Actinomyces urinae]|uniref:DUF3159 domain-containing protein n=1 Tax=Actinomyces urinae TaxID=1689268 RepID=UPI0009311C2F|nr:DUF3159 domain-containing protein [Actinomyces urinae]
MTDSIDEAAGKPGGKSKSLASQLNADQFDAWQAVGGVRGAIESVLPVLVFVVAYVIAMDLKWPLILAGGISVALILVRLISRQPITYSVSGFVGVAIGVVWALWSGRGENFFAFGIIASAAYGLVIMAANLVRYPVVSMALTPVWQLRWKWWQNPGSLDRLARVSRSLSWLWFALFALRFLVQIPLWLGGQVAMLGTAKLLLGLPLFLLVAWVTWVQLRPYREVVQTESDGDAASAN